MPERTFSDEHLVRFALDDVTDGEREAMEAHVADSIAAMAFIDRVRKVIEIMRGDESEAPSSAAVQRALDGWAPPPSIGVPDVVAVLRRVAAVLVFDSRAQPAIAGFRGADDGYQLAFDCEPAQLDVRVAPVGATQPDLWRVRGQVTLREPGSVTAVRLLATGSSEAVATTGADEDGQFKLDAVAGSYDLSVEMAATAIVAGLALGLGPG